jgi:large subunit ribosomal protein L10
LYGKIMFLLNAPAQRVASAMSAVARNMAVVVKEAAKENKFSS